MFIILIKRWYLPICIIKMWLVEATIKNTERKRKNQLLVTKIYILALLHKFNFAITYHLKAPSIDGHSTYLTLIICFS